MRHPLVSQIIVVGIILVASYLLESYRSYILPKRIWAYWDRNVPDSIRANIENNKKVLYDWEYTFLTEKTLPQYLDPITFPDQFVTLSAPHRADYIRLELLKRYGGVWMDAGIIVHSRDELNKMRREAMASKAQLSAFTLTEKQHLYIENWFIMAPLYSQVIHVWSKEYTSAVTQGFLQYKQALFKEKDIHIIEKIYKRDDENVYLTQHACLQAVLQKRLKKPGVILLYKSEDNMFKIQVQCEWDTACVKDRIKSDPSIKKISFIKLRGSDRESN